MTPDELAVLAVLRCTDHATHTTSQICNSADLNRRDVEAAISSLRRGREGQEPVPILGDSKGMRLARSRDEALEAAERLRSRAINQLQTANAVMEAAMAMGDGWQVAEEPRLGL